MVDVFVRVTLPEELLQVFFQAIRDFDMKYDPNHEGKVQFEALTETDWPAEKMAEVMSAITPPSQYMYIARKKSDCLCIPGCSVNGVCPIHGDAAMGRS